MRDKGWEDDQPVMLRLYMDGLCIPQRMNGKGAAAIGFGRAVQIIDAAEYAVMLHLCATCLRVDMGAIKIAVTMRNYAAFCVVYREWRNASGGAKILKAGMDGSPKQIQINAHAARKPL